MKGLVKYINEALVSKSGTKHLFKITKDNAKNVGLIEDKLSDFLMHSKKRYSFTNKNDLKQFFDDFVSYSGISKDVLKELLVFDDTSKQPSRIKCATLSANGIKDYLEEKNHS